MMRDCRPAGRPGRAVPCPFVLCVQARRPVAAQAVTLVAAGAAGGARAGIGGRRAGAAGPVRGCAGVAGVGVGASGASECPGRATYGRMLRPGMGTLETVLRL